MYDIVILGGDIRQIYMVKCFLSRSFSVITYGLSHPMLPAGCYQATSLKEALSLAHVLIGPIPLLNESNHIPALTSSSDLNKDALLLGLHKEHLLFAGMIPASVCAYCKMQEISYYDFMKEDCVAIANGIATAEGAIAEAIFKSKGNLHMSNTLVIGYGRCAKILAQKLAGLHATVSICARKEMDLSMANACGYHCIRFPQLSETIDSFSYIFNTVPALVLTKSLLACVNEDATIIDIASYPGGLDYSSAKELRKNANLCLGIPGKVAPMASAQILANYCMQTIACKK